MKPLVAMVGLGQMGSAMAARLAEAGCDVLGWDIDAHVRARNAQQGIAVARSLREALERRSVVLTSLPNADAVRGAWLGEQGVAALASVQAVCIDLSTIEPDAMRTVAQAAADKGLAVLDCPVSGGPLEARAGKLILMAGGDPAVIERVRPVLGMLGETLMHTGAVGTAKVVKIVNNMMAMGNLLVASEAFSLGVSAGVDPARLFEVLAESGGRSQTFTKRFPNALRGDFEPRFKMELGEKDLALGVALARTQGVPAPAASLVREMFGLALLEGHRGRDVVALLEMYRRWAELGSGQGAAQHTEKTQ
jgi:3-hydroxyisobutyrate dehydrogenase-like beta-hydroxyacid dehydrogenase